MSGKTVPEGNVMHRVMFPERDVREVARTSEDVLLEECRNCHASLDVEAFSYLGKCIRKYAIMKLTNLRAILSDMNVKGPSTFNHTAACVTAAEKEIETERMRERDPNADDLFVVEDHCGDTARLVDRPASPDRVNKRKVSWATDGVPILDRQQRRAVDTAKIKRLTMINAGPGTGKSTTLSVLIKEAIETVGSAKILFLSFTKRAEMVIKERLSCIGLDEFVLDKRELYQSPGICILTFDKYAYMFTKEMFATYSLGKQESLPHLKELSKQGIPLLDYLIVDECQDLSLVEYQMMKEVASFTRRTVLAGDPRQECFAECSYFGKEWCNTEESESP